MGQVFLGMSAGGRPIAVKVIRTELATDPDFRARFRREVAAAQKVSGLFTALVVDADLDCPVPWLATAYVAGPSLTEAVRGHGPLPVSSLMALAAGLAEGLGAIHAAGVVHRDLKPSNVLLAEDGPRVIDFGISEAAEASAAASVSVTIGSPGYMSPEQVLGVDIGPASDVFSLGAVLAFAATGQGPFGTGSSAALMYRLVNSPADLAEMPAELRPLVDRCLAKNPGDRPTARELLAEVGAMQPAPGWLAEPIMSGFADGRPAALRPSDASKLVALTDASGQPPRSVPPPRAGTSAPGRHRPSRTMASAVLTGGLVVGSAVAAFALIGANRAPGHDLQPQAGAGAVATLPVSASNPPASPGASPSASPSAAASAPVSPSAFLSPAASGLSSTSMPPTPVFTPSSIPSSGSSNPGSPPASSAPASSHPSSPPASSPPASSPPASSPPASSPPASSPPASSPPASSPPASSPPASSPPASAPPASSPAASSPPASSPAAAAPSPAVSDTGSSSPSPSASST